MNRIGFDNEKYVKLQSQNIRDRISQFGGKLYLEFGGKLFDDYHAARVLPGFEPDSKVKMLLEMKDDAEIVIVLSADDIERSKRRGDLGITYDEDTLRLIDAFRGIGLYIGSVVITHYREQNAAEKFVKKSHSIFCLSAKVVLFHSSLSTLIQFVLYHKNMNKKSLNLSSCPLGALVIKYGFVNCFSGERGP